MYISTCIQLTLAFNIFPRARSLAFCDNGNKPVEFLYLLVRFSCIPLDMIIGESATAAIDGKGLSKLAILAGVLCVGKECTVAIQIRAIIAA